ncbi:MAG: hypothetical protein IJE50_04730 [Clostridia bacterium]|nr:hypothetical protein [Clostridia bacterium]MBQ2914809.1 hypothetical protein [Clostridia bacterium]
MKPYITEAYIYSLNKGKLTSTEKREVTVLAKQENGQYVVDYCGVKCLAIFNPFTGALYADDIYGRID